MSKNPFNSFGSPTSGNFDVPIIITRCCDPRAKFLYSRRSFLNREGPSLSLLFLPPVKNCSHSSIKYMNSSFYMICKYVQISKEIILFVIVGRNHKKEIVNWKHIHFIVCHFSFFNEYKSNKKLLLLLL